MSQPTADSPVTGFCAPQSSNGYPSRTHNCLAAVADLTGRKSWGIRVVSAL